MGKPFLIALTWIGAIKPANLVGSGFQYFALSSERKKPCIEHAFTDRIE